MTSSFTGLVCLIFVVSAFKKSIKLAKKSEKFPLKWPVGKHLGKKWRFGDVLARCLVFVVNELSLDSQMRRDEEVDANEHQSQNRPLLEIPDEKHARHLKLNSISTIFNSDLLLFRSQQLVHIKLMGSLFASLVSF